MVEQRFAGSDSSYSNSHVLSGSSSPPFVVPDVLASPRNVLPANSSMAGKLMCGYVSCWILYGLNTFQRFE